MGTPLRLLADENIDPKLIDWLRGEGHDVLAVKAKSAGAADEEVVAISMRESRVIVTRDKDFGELAVRYAQPVPGVILIRLQASSRAEYLQLFAERWPRILPHLHGHLTVVTNASLRIRPLNPKA